MSCAKIPFLRSFQYDIMPLSRASTRGRYNLILCITLDLSGRGLRRDTRGYYQGVGMPGGLVGLVLPLSEYLEHGILRILGSSHLGVVTSQIVSL